MKNGEAVLMRIFTDEKLAGATILRGIKDFADIGLVTLAKVEVLHYGKAALA